MNVRGLILATVLLAGFAALWLYGPSSEQVSRDVSDEGEKVDAPKLPPQLEGLVRDDSKLVESGPAAVSKEPSSSVEELRERRVHVEMASGARLREVVVQPIGAGGDLAGTSGTTDEEGDTSIQTLKGWNGHLNVFRNDYFGFDERFRVALSDELRVVIPSDLHGRVVDERGRGLEGVPLLLAEEGHKTVSIATYGRMPATHTRVDGSTVEGYRPIARRMIIGLPTPVVGPDGVARVPTPEWMKITRTRTTEKGRFSFVGLKSDRSYALWAPIETAAWDVVAHVRRDPVEVVVRLEQARFRVRAVDAVTGKAIEASTGVCRVWHSSMPEAYDRLSYLPTPSGVPGTRGRIGSLWLVQLIAPRYKRRDYLHEITEANRDVLFVDIPMEPVGPLTSLRVKVVDERGNIIEPVGLDIRQFNGAPKQPIARWSKGVAVVPGLDPGRVVIYAKSSVLGSPGLSEHRYLMQPPHATFQVGGDHPSDVEIVVPSGGAIRIEATFPSVLDNVSVQSLPVVSVEKVPRDSEERATEWAGASNLWFEWYRATDEGFAAPKKFMRVLHIDTDPLESEALPAGEYKVFVGGGINLGLKPFEKTIQVEAGRTTLVRVNFEAAKER